MISYNDGYYISQYSEELQIFLRSSEQNIRIFLNIIKISMRSGGGSV